MADRMPLSALLSQALVAFTIEFDNEFEHQTPHRTTNHGSTAGSSSAPWLVSMAMWIKFMRFVPDEGVTVREFQQAASVTNKEMKMWLTRLSKWWGYVAVDKDTAEDPFHWRIRPTNGGQEALQVWRRLTTIIEKRWQKRLGNEFDELRQSLQSLVAQLNPDLPDFLPILGYNMLSADPDPSWRARTKTDTVSSTKYTLPILFSKALLAFATEYENGSRLSMAISANVLRLVGDEGTRVRDLPGLSGVSKEAIAIATKRLQEADLATIPAGSKNSRLKAIFLNAQGRRARDTYNRLVFDLEKRWEANFGTLVVTLRRALENLARESPIGKSALFAGLTPYSDGWRAAVRSPEVLPHYPMVLHRGGFPDGS